MKRILLYLLGTGLYVFVLILSLFLCAGLFLVIISTINYEERRQNALAHYSTSFSRKTVEELCQKQLIEATSMICISPDGSLTYGDVPFLLDDKITANSTYADIETLLGSYLFSCTKQVSYNDYYSCRYRIENFYVRIDFNKYTDKIITYPLIQQYRYLSRSP